MSSNKFNGFWFLGVIVIPVILCKNVENSASEMLESAGIVTNYIRLKRQLDNFLPNDFNRMDRNLEMVEFLPETDRIEGQEDVPVVDQLPEADRVAVQNGELTLVEQLPANGRVAAEEGDIPVVEQLPEADRVAEQERDIPVVEELPESERIAGQEEGVPVVEQLSESDRVAGQDENVPVVERFPEAERVAEHKEVVPLPESERVAGQEKNVPFVEQFPEADRVAGEKFPWADRIAGQENSLPVVEQLPEVDRVEGPERKGILTEEELPLVEQFPFAESVRQEEGGDDIKNNIDISKLPISDKVKETPDNDYNLPEIETFPEAESVKIEQSIENEDNENSIEALNMEYLPGTEKVKEEHAGENMYADDALVAAIIPPETQKTDLNPERVVDGKITDNVDIKTIKRLDNWEPDDQPMEADRVQGDDDMAYDEDLEASGVKEEPQTKNAERNPESPDVLGAISAKLDKIDQEIYILSEKIDGLIAGLENKDEVLEINKKDTEEIENVVKGEVPEGNEQDEQGADVSENSLDQGKLLLPGSQDATEPGTGAS